jgi:hypothetical protein
MKHLAKDIWVHKLDKYNFELFRKWHRENKDGSLKVDDDGNLVEGKATIGYYSNMDAVWCKIKDLGYEEFLNADLNACKHLIDQASDNLKEYMDDIR